MRRKNLFIVMLSLLIVFSLVLVLVAKDVSNQTQANKIYSSQLKQLKPKAQKSGWSAPIKGGPIRSVEDRIRARIETVKQRGLTKQQLINQSNKRSALRNRQEPFLYTDKSDYTHTVLQVPGGGDVYTAWEATFDTEADFLTFDLVDLSGQGWGNDWLWFDYINYLGWPPQYISYNSMIAPEPGGDFDGFLGPVPLGARDEVAQIKVGVPKFDSAGTTPYRVANLLVDLYLGNADVDGDGDGYLDDYFMIELMEDNKWQSSTEEAFSGNSWACHTGQEFTDGTGYNNEWLERLTTKPITLPGSGSITLSFQHMIYSETSDWDGGNVKISTDGGATWTVIVPDGGYDAAALWAFTYHGGIANDVEVNYGTPSPYDQPGYCAEMHSYELETFNLSSYGGETVQIAWEFAADGGYVEDGGGWWIDDIKISNGSTVFENDGSDNGDLIQESFAPGWLGEPWVELNYYYDTAGGTTVADDLGITNHVIGALGDSVSFRFRAIFDDNDDQNAGGDSNWGYEVSNAQLVVSTRYTRDIGVTSLDLDTTFAQGGAVVVGQTYDPQVVVSNFGLEAFTIYNTFVKIENSFGSRVYQNYIYTYAPGQGDTLKAFPATQEFNENQTFYNFPDWTVPYEGDYTLIGYTEVFGGDQESHDDSMVVNFHAYGEAPIFSENFNTMTDSALYNTWTLDDPGSNWYIDDLFGEGDTELTLFDYQDASLYDATIWSPILDCSGLSQVAMRIQHWTWHDYDSTYRAQILTTVDGGANVDVIKDMDMNTPGSMRSGWFVIDLSSVADGQNNLQVGFHYESNGIGLVAGYNYYTVDDIDIYAGADFTPPDKPANLATASGDMQVGLTWDAVTGAQLYSVYADSAGNWADAAHIVDVDQTMYTHTGLTNNESLTYWVTVTDYNGNEGDPSDPAVVVPEDVTPPTKITDLAAVPVLSSIMLTWTTPNETVPAEGSFYDIRYAYEPITSDNWNNDEVVFEIDDEPAVLAAGESASMVTEVLVELVDVYFAMTTTDEEGQVSAMSNVALSDIIPPAPIEDLEVVDLLENSVTLKWTARGEDGTSGGAATLYDLRVYYGDAMTDWEQAAVVPNVPKPGQPGEVQTFMATENVYPASTKMAFAMVAIDNNGNMSALSNVVVSKVWEPGTTDITEEAALPTEFALDQNYPNPFNPTTAISYQLPNDTEVSIIIYGATGQKIRTLVDGPMNAGYHNVEWDARFDDGSKAPSGIYLMKLQCDEYTSIKRMILMK